MQIFGGRSFFTDEPFERMIRDAYINMIGEGSNDVLRVFIGAAGFRDIGVDLRSLFQAARNPANTAGALRRFAATAFRRIARSVVPVQSPLLQVMSVLIRKLKWK